jgi:tRNA U34 5-methylaminomethyl-2-thiouridine-forming methyltransferase MnmC
MQAKRQSAVQAAAKDCIRVLEDTMPDWGNDMYNDIRTYAVKNGLPQHEVDQYTDPNVIMLINKARLYDESKATAQSKKAKAKVIKKTKKTKVLSSKKSPPTKTQIKKANAQKAQQKLRDNPKYGGGMDDIADALMARWET